MKYLTRDDLIDINKTITGKVFYILPDYEIVDVLFMLNRGGNSK